MIVAYLTGSYPRVSHTFIAREIAGLRALGIEVRPCSIRRTEAAHVAGAEQVAAQAETFHILEAVRSRAGLRALGSALRRPGRLARALGLAWRTAPKGVRGRAYNLIYLVEAVVLADHLRRIGAAHLHDHIAMASCTVAMLAAELADIPWSFTLHGPDVFYAPLHWRLDEKIRRADFVSCISHFARSQAMLFSDPAEWDKLRIVHCGVDPARYAAPQVPGADRLLFVGRLAAVKGVPVLLEAFARLRVARPGATLTVVGDGPERAGLEAAVARAGIAGAVTFRGNLSQDGVAEALRYADVLCVPSFAEGVPVVLMEAMAAGVPVVASAVGGIGELVRDGVTGRLVPPGDTTALVEAINAVLDGDFGGAGRAVVAEHFDSDREAARLAVLFTAAAGNAAWPEGPR